VFFRPHGVRVNRRREKLRVPESPLHEIERNPVLHGGHADPVPQSLRRSMKSGQPGVVHHVADVPPRCDAASRPQTYAGAAIGAAVCLADAVTLSTTTAAWELRRRPPPPLLERLKDEGSGGEVHAIDGQRQRLGDGAPPEGEDSTERPHSVRMLVGGAQETGSLVGGQVFACAVVKQFSGRPLPFGLKKAAASGR